MLGAIIDKALYFDLARRGLRSRFLDTRFGRMHRLEGEGEGTLPPIVLIHGLGASALSYYPLMLILRRYTRRLIAIDLMAHGQSKDFQEPLDFRIIMESAVEGLRLILDEPAIIFGNSLGGGVSFNLAVFHPELVHTLILASPAGAPFNEHDLADVQAIFAINSWRKARDFFERVYHRSPPLAFLLYARMRRIYSAPAIQGFLATLPLGEVVAPRLINGLTMPIYVMWGKSDRILPRSHLAYFRQNLPASTRFEELESMGHCPFLEYPHSIAERMLRFIG